MLGVLLEPPKALLSTVQFVTIKIKDQVSESHNTTGEKGTRDNNQNEMIRVSYMACTAYRETAKIVHLYIIKFFFIKFFGIVTGLYQDPEKSIPYPTVSTVQN